MSSDPLPPCPVYLIVRRSGPMGDRIECEESELIGYRGSWWVIRRNGVTEKHNGGSVRYESSDGVLSEKFRFTRQGAWVDALRKCVWRAFLAGAGTIPGRSREARRQAGVAEAIFLASRQDKEADS